MAAAIGERHCRDRCAIGDAGQQFAQRSSSPLASSALTASTAEDRNGAHDQRTAHLLHHDLQMDEAEPGAAELDPGTSSPWRPSSSAIRRPQCAVESVVGLHRPSAPPVRRSTLRRSRVPQSVAQLAWSESLNCRPRSSVVAESQSVANAGRGGPCPSIRRRASGCCSARTTRSRGMRRWNSAHRGAQFLARQMRSGAAVRARAERQVSVRAATEVDLQRIGELVGIHGGERGRHEHPVAGFHLAHRRTRRRRPTVRAVLMKLKTRSSSSTAPEISSGSTTSSRRCAGCSARKRNTNDNAAVTVSRPAMNSRKVKFCTSSLVTGRSVDRRGEQVGHQIVAGVGWPVRRSGCAGIR